MSNTFVTMYNKLRLDPTNFASTAKFSYTACKRITGMTMQTIPNGSVFNCIGEMKRASFSMVKRQISIASPLNDNIAKCQYSKRCKICEPFVKVIDKSDLNEVKQETLRVVQECKKKLEQLIEEKEELNLPENELETDEVLIDSVVQMQQFYEMVKIKECSVTTATNTTDLEEFILILQTILVHYDENNQYGNSLKQILPVGNYC